MKEINTQIGRIKTILKPPAYASQKILSRVIANLKELSNELPKHRARVKFTNSKNISRGIVSAPRGIDEWFGLIAVRVADLMEVKIIWKNLLDAGSVGVNKSMLVVGDKYDIILALHILGYLKLSLDYLHHYVSDRAKTQNKIIRAARRAGLSPEKTIDAREMASNARSKAIKDICTALDKQLEKKGDNKKEQEILKYIFNNLKPDFADKPGPKVPRHYNDKIDWDKARTAPTEFVNNKLIN